MLNRSASFVMSISVLKALPGKLDIKRHSPSILYISPYAIMGHCTLLMKNDNFYDVWSLNRVILIRTLSNLFTMLSTVMSFLSSNIVYITIFLQELLPFVHEILPLFAM